MLYEDNEGNKVVEVTHQIASLNTPRVYRPAFHSPPQEITWAAAAMNATVLVLLGARQAYEIAYSYRNFRVGAAAMTLFTDEPHVEMSLLHGANIKTSSADTNNVHAEHMVLSSIGTAIKYDSEQARVPVMALVGDTQNDQQSGRPMTTLHPCGKCRSDLMSSESPIGPETLFLTATPDMRTIQFSNLELLGLYHRGEIAESEIPTIQFDQTPAALTPLPRKRIRGEVNYLSAYETPEAIAEDDLLREALLMPVSRFSQILSERYPDRIPAIYQPDYDFTKYIEFRYPWQPAEEMA